MIVIDIWLHFGSKNFRRGTQKCKIMNMKNKTHKYVPTNSQINLSAQEFE